MAFPFLHFNRVHCAALLAAALLLAAISSSAAGSACRVVVVRSADLQPHFEVVRGLRAVCECSVREVSIGDGEGSDKVLALTPDIVVAVGTSALRKVKDISNVPLVYAMVVPSEANRINALNISGVTMDISPATYLNAIKHLFPQKKRIGLIYDARYTGAFVQEAEKEAKAAGLDLVSQQINDSSKLPGALAAIQNKVDIFWMLPDTTVVIPQNVELLLRFSFQKNIPVFTFSRKYLEMGAVASLEVDPYDIGVQVGKLTNRIKSNPVSITEYSRLSHLTLNQKIAHKMGFTITQEMVREVKGID